MFWIVTLAIISLVLLFAGSASLVASSRRYRQRSESNRARAMVEMMKVANQAGEGKDQVPEPGPETGSSRSL